MARLKQKLLEGEWMLHTRNGGFRVPADLKRREVQAGVQCKRNAAFKQVNVPTLRVVWIDTAKNKYDRRGKRKPATLPENRRFKEAA